MQSAGVEAAVFGGNADLRDGIGFEAVEDEELVRSLEFNRGVRGRSGIDVVACVVGTAFFEAAGGAGVAVVVVVTADGVLAGDFVNAVAKPFRLGGLRGDVPDSSFEAAGQGAR